MEGMGGGVDVECGDLAPSRACGNARPVEDPERSRTGLAPAGFGFRNLRPPRSVRPARRRRCRATALHMNRRPTPISVASPPPSLPSPSSLLKYSLCIITLFALQNLRSNCIIARLDYRNLHAQPLMAPSRRIAAVSITLLSAYLLVASIHPNAAPHAPALPPPYERAFMPGPLGLEPGNPPPKPASDAFLSRFIDVGRDSAATQWSRINQLGPTIHFIHNLGEIIGGKDYTRDPRLCPKIGGAPFNPIAHGYHYSQPDLGSQATVDFVAKAALRDLLPKLHPTGAAGAIEGDARGSTHSTPYREAKALVQHNRPVQDYPSFSIGINDGIYFGESAGVRKWEVPPRYFRDRPDYSDLVFDFSNRVAREVERDLPRGSSDDWSLGCLAYYWCENAPDFPVDRHIAPFLCADISQGYDKAFWTEEQDLEKRWAQAGPKRLGVYTYLDGSGFLIPRVFTKLISEHIAHIHRLGFTDYFGESTPNWGLDGPQLWMTAQLLAHPDQHRTPLLNEYFTRYYQSAAQPMRAFFDGCEHIWMSQCGPTDWLRLFRNESQAELFTSARCAALRNDLTQAQSLATSDLVRKRIAFVSGAFSVTEALAHLYEAKKALSNTLADHGSGSNPLTPSDRNKIAEDLGRLKLAQAQFDNRTAQILKKTPTALHGAIEREFVYLSPQTAAQDLLNPQPESPISLGWHPPYSGRQLIAGLQFQAALPAGWASALEPGEHSSEWIDATGVLHLNDQRFTRIYTSLPIPPGTASYRVEAWMKGSLSPVPQIAILLNYLDSNNQIMVGQVGMRYFPKHWRISIVKPLVVSHEPETYRRLSISKPVPAGAKYVNVMILAQQMLPGDEVQVKDIKLYSRGAPLTATH